MKVVKPQKLAMVTRCFEQERRFYMGFGVLAMHRFGGAIVSEMEMWTFLARELGQDGAPDAGMPKSRGEFLATGYAFPPGVAPAATAAVRVQVGTLQKTLNVYGDRYWRTDRVLGRAPTEPAPFTRMPIGWETAFGGEGFDRNPRGKGYAPIETEEGVVFPLANVELPGHSTASPETAEPACFGPIDFTWPQRAAKAGTYDARWLAELFPGFARDMDWSIFNIAAEDQQQDAPFRGDEVVVVDGMHPQRPRLEGRLPGLVARCYVNAASDEGEVFEEVQTRLTTVWLFPHAERYLLVYHGWREVRDEDGADVLQAVIAAERAGEPKGSEHYRAVLAQRLDPDEGAVHSLRESDLLPPNLPEEPDAALEEMRGLVETEGLLRKHQRLRQEQEVEQRRAFIASLGLDPDLHGPSLPPEPDLPAPEEAPAVAARLKAEGEKRIEEEKERQKERNEWLRPLLLADGLDADAILAEAEQAVRGPPLFTAAEEIAKLRALSAEMRAMGTPVDELDEYADSPEYNRMFAEAEQNMREAYRQMAHDQDAAERFSGDDAARSRSAALATLQSQGNLARANLTGFDLSGLDLRGVDLSGAWLENANLARADLEGADLSEAVLARADLTDANLTGAKLGKANLGLSRMLRTRADGATLSEAILNRAQVEEASLRGALLDGADWTEAEVRASDLTQATLTGAIFMKNDLTGFRLVGADLGQCTFIEVDVNGVDFSGANLEGSTFLNSNGAGATFDGARMTECRFVEGCSFEGASFRKAVLTRVNLRSTKLSGADLSEASLDGADLSECDLSGASLLRARARDALLIKADLSGARLASADLMNALLQNADLSGTDLRGANLFQANLSRVVTDEGTNVQDANRKKARLLPERPRQ